MSTKTSPPPAHVAAKPSHHNSSRGTITTFRNGLGSRLRPEDSVLVLTDHQPYQLAKLNSHDPQMVVNNRTGLAKAAKIFNIPTILTSVIAAQGGLLFPSITDMFPDQEVIDRTFIDTWEDKVVVDAVRATGRKQLIIAGLWTEICTAMPAIQALGEGWDVTVVTDASGGTSLEAHQVGIQRTKPARFGHRHLISTYAERRRRRSATGALPNTVLYSRLNCEGL